ncbi:hypothetical protein M433DRAFT_63717 [Acidomyces richmondensis BFW]|nr:hypothetical protein M433DRAFT_63717 [Acidomyces richmondensis BFW]
MFISVLVAIGCLASNVIADGASIVAALDKISDATAQLNNSVISWDGSLLGTLPIIADSTALLADINSATKTAEQSANLTDLEALGVGLATLSLASDVNTTLATIEAAKPKFQRLLLAPLILLNLELEKGATDQFSAAVLQKVPAALQSTAEGITSGIDDAFDQAINDYNLLSDL